MQSIRTESLFDANRELLDELPPPQVAVDYWSGPDMRLYDEFQTEAEQRRRPRIESLLHVFEAIRDDEGQHVATMAACQKGEVMSRAKQLERFAALSALLASVADQATLTDMLEGGMDLLEVQEDLQPILDLLGNVLNLFS